MRSILFLYGKNDFVDIFKNLVKYRSENKYLLLDHQNNDVGHSNIIRNATKNFDILTIRLSVLDNY